MPSFTVRVSSPEQHEDHHVTVTADNDGQARIKAAQVAIRADRLGAGIAHIPQSADATVHVVPEVERDALANRHDIVIELARYATIVRRTP